MICHASYVLVLLAFAALFSTASPVVRARTSHPVTRLPACLTVQLLHALWPTSDRSTAPVWTGAQPLHLSRSDVFSHNKLPTIPCKHTRCIHGFVREHGGRCAGIAEDEKAHSRMVTSRVAASSASQHQGWRLTCLQSLDSFVRPIPQLSQFSTSLRQTPHPPCLLHPLNCPSHPAFSISSIIVKFELIVPFTPPPLPPPASPAEKAAMLAIRTFWTRRHRAQHLKTRTIVRRPCHSPPAAVSQSCSKHFSRCKFTVAGAIHDTSILYTRLLLIRKLQGWFPSSTSTL